MDQLKLKEKLKAIVLFKKMDEPFFENFITTLEVIKFSQNSAILTEGDTGTDMFILLNGTVRINKKTVSGDVYTVALLRDEMGVFFGEVGLLSEDKRSATVLAETPCEIARLSGEHFDAFLQKHPAHGVKILKELSVAICQKLKKSNHDTTLLYETLIQEIGQTFL